MLRLRINPLVVSDLKGIREYIAEDNAEKATETIEKIYGKFESNRCIALSQIQITPREI